MKDLWLEDPLRGTPDPAPRTCRCPSADRARRSSCPAAGRAKCAHASSWLAAALQSSRSLARLRTRSTVWPSRLNGVTADRSSSCVTAALPTSRGRRVSEGAVAGPAEAEADRIAIAVVDYLPRGTRVAADSDGRRAAGRVLPCMVRGRCWPSSSVSSSGRPRSWLQRARTRNWTASISWARRSISGSRAAISSRPAATCWRSKRTATLPRAARRGRPEIRKALRRRARASSGSRGLRHRRH